MGGRPKTVGSAKWSPIEPEVSSSTITRLLICVCADATPDAHRSTRTDHPAVDRMGTSGREHTPTAGGAGPLAGGQGGLVPFDRRPTLGLPVLSFPYGPDTDVGVLW